MLTDSLNKWERLHSKLQLQKEELARLEQDRKFNFKDGLITVVVPGGLLYAAAIQQRHKQTKMALDNVTIRLDELTQEIIEFRFTTSRQSLLAALRQPDAVTMVMKS